MSTWGCLRSVRPRDAAGGLVVRFGVALLDAYLEFLAVRSQPNTVMRAWIASRRWLRVYQSPGYAPELNPTENIWSSLKHSMADLAPGTIIDLHRTTKNRLKSAIQTSPDRRVPRRDRTRSTLTNTTLKTLTPKGQ
jgi:hypothetical protein